MARPEELLQPPPPEFRRPLEQRRGFTPEQAATNQPPLEPGPLETTRLGELLDFARRAFQEPGTLLPESLQNITPGQMGRIGLEAGLSTAATLAIPEAAVPLQVARMLGPASRLKTAFGLGQRAAASGAGAGVGSLASEAFDPTPDPLSTAQQAALFGGAADLAIPFLLQPRRLLGATLKPGAEQAITEISKRGGILTPALATESKAFDAIENFAEAGVMEGVLGGTMRSARDDAIKIAERMVDDFIQAQGTGTLTREDVGEFIQTAIENSTETFKRAAAARFRLVDRASQGVTVSYRPVKREAQRLLRESQAGLGEGQTVLQRVLAKPDFVPFHEAQILRSDLSGVGRSGQELIGGKEQGMAKRLASFVDRQMEIASRALNPDAIRRFREANAFWRGNRNQPGIRTFNNAIFKHALRSDPDAVVDTFIKSAKPTRIRRLRQVIDPTTFDELGGEVARKWITDPSMQTAEGRLSGVKFVRALERMGTESLELLYGKNGAKELFRLAEQLRLTQGSPRFEGIRVAIALGQAGIIGDLGTGLFGGQFASPGRMAFFLGGPAAVSRIIRIPGMARLLTLGLQAERGTGLAISVVTRVLALAKAHGIPVVAAPSDLPAGAQPPSISIQPQ